MPTSKGNQSGVPGEHSSPWAFQHFFVTVKSEIHRVFCGLRHLVFSFLGWEIYADSYTITENFEACKMSFHSQKGWWEFSISIQQLFLCCVKHYFLSSKISFCGIIIKIISLNNNKSPCYIPVGAVGLNHSFSQGKILSRELLLEHRAVTWGMLLLALSDFVLHRKWDLQRRKLDSSNWIAMRFE